MKKILLSGIKSTGQLHIGNYFGVMRQFVGLQNDHRSFIFIADLHSLTTVQDAKKMQEMTFDLAVAYLAIGLDPEKVNLFKQSDVPEVTELAWIFSCITTMPYLMRAHAFKDAEAKGREINAGVFSYPLLMAADILIYDADVVPVGKDQKQHIEIARDVAEKFNHTFGETFQLPAELIKEEVETIPGTDGQKMSKSYDNIIPLFGTPEEITKAVMSIKTDSTPLGEPLDTKSDIVFSLHKLVSTSEEMENLKKDYENGAVGFGDSKKLLAAKLIEYFGPAQEHYEELRKDPAMVHKVLKEGAEKARSRANEKMKVVRQKVGLTL